MRSYLKNLKVEFTVQLLYPKSTYVFKVHLDNTYSINCMTSVNSPTRLLGINSLFSFLKALLVPKTSYSYLKNLKVEFTVQRLYPKSTYVFKVNLDTTYSINFMTSGNSPTRLLCINSLFSLLRAPLVPKTSYSYLKNLKVEFTIQLLYPKSTYVFKVHLLRHYVQYKLHDLWKFTNKALMY